MFCVELLFVGQIKFYYTDTQTLNHRFFATRNCGNPMFGSTWNLLLPHLPPPWPLSALPLPPSLLPPGLPSPLPPHCFGRRLGCCHRCLLSHCRGRLSRHLSRCLGHCLSRCLGRHLGSCCRCGLGRCLSHPLGRRPSPWPLPWLLSPLLP